MPGLSGHNYLALVAILCTHRGTNTCGESDPGHGPRGWEESMGPITTAIVAVLPALASEMVKLSVKDAYERLKAVICRKWGDATTVAKAIAALEEDPKSKAQAAVLEEKLEAVKAAEDAEVLQALHRLAEQMK